jgi:hypothetical protein
MRGRRLVARGLVHYWRTHLAVVLGVAAAAAVLGGSLVVGDSVRGSLARTALERLGRTTHVVESGRFFREELASGLAADPSFAADFDGACPIVALSGVATHGASARRAGDVLVYGVDARFWAFHGVPAPERHGERDALLSASLAAEIGAAAGDAVVVRTHAASDIPGSSLFGRRDDPARALRLTVAGVLPRAGLGELTWRPRSGPVRAVFVPLPSLQRTLGLEGRANAILVAASGESVPASRLRAAVKEAATLEDLGLRLRVLPAAGALQLETTSALVDDALATTAASVAREQGLHVTEVLAYLANALRAGGREVPYSLVAAVDDEALRTLAGRDVADAAGRPPIVLNDWAASELQAQAGDILTME